MTIIVGWVFRSDYNNRKLYPLKCPIVRFEIEEENIGKACKKIRITKGDGFPAWYVSGDYFNTEVRGHNINYIIEDEL